MIKPSEHYQREAQAQGFYDDPAQRQALRELDRLQSELVHNSKRSRFKKIYKPKSIKGLYLWGHVGTGKSYLLNLFYSTLPIDAKIRLHFHEFMQSVHQELKTEQGKQNPLNKIAKRWAKKYSVLCFDEFFVKDIADAMLLGKLLTKLFEQGVCVAATSNLIPDDLYKNGLQRQRFLPAIEVIKQHMQVLEVDNHIDYRKTKNAAFIEHDGDKLLWQEFTQLANGKIHSGTIEVAGLTLDCHAYAQNIAWFDFAKLCEVAVGNQQYFALAKRFAAIIIAQLPAMNDRHNDSAVRFLHCIDIFYDQQKQVILALEQPLTDLYHGEKWQFEFQRTISRLQEMQAHWSTTLGECDD